MILKKKRKKEIHPDVRFECFASFAWQVNFYD
jgi:hypothetical protein